MAKKIAGEYIAELQVQFDKQSQNKQAKTLFNQHVANVKKQNDYTVKQAEKTGEQSAKASIKGAEKQTRKSSNRAMGLLRSLSKLALLGEKYLKKLPVIGQLAGGLSSFALGGRFLSYDPQATIDKISKYANDEGRSYNTLSNLIGSNKNAGAKLKAFVINSQNQGLSKEQALNLLQSAVSRTGSIDSAIPYIQDALSNFNQQDNLIAKQSVAKAYGLDANTLAGISTYQDAVNRGDITPSKYVSPKGLQQGINTETRASIQINRSDVASDIAKDDKVIALLSTSFDNTIKLVNKVNSIDLKTFNTKLETLSTQVEGYNTIQSTLNLLDKAVDKSAKKIGDVTTGFTDLNTALEIILKTIFNFTGEGNKPKGNNFQPIKSPHGDITFIPNSAFTGDTNIK